MPAYTRGVARDQFRYVLLKAAQLVYYGFSTKEFDATQGVTQQELSEQLGHLTAAPPSSLIIVRASSPQPTRVRKITRRNPSADQQGSVSTFCGADNIRDAITAGWSVAKRAIGVQLTNNARTKTAICQISNGQLYAFAVNASDYNTYKDELGWIDPATINTDAEIAKLVRGSSLPRPGKAVKALEDGSKITKFFSNGADLATNGWSQLENEVFA